MGAAALQESGLKNAEQAGQENQFLTSGDDQSQGHITADNNRQDVMDSGKFIPVAVTSNPVANNGVSSGKQKSARSHGHAPINQSSSFKKVMYSVGMRDEEF